MKVETRGWEAYENREPPINPEAVPFYVVGEVTTSSGSIQPVLAKAEPQGINPANLILELTLHDSGDAGTADVDFRDVRFDETITKGQYDSVEIRFEGGSVASIGVKVVD